MLDRIVMYLVQARYYLESSLAISEGTEKVPFGIKDLKNFFKTIF